MFCNTSGDADYWQDFCDLKGIKRELTIPYNPPQNGVAKRMNEMIQVKIRSVRVVRCVVCALRRR